MKYIGKDTMLKEIDEEIAINLAGCNCASKHVKVICRNRVNYLTWVSSRIMRDLPYDNVPSTKTVLKL